MLWNFNDHQNKRALFSDDGLCYTYRDLVELQLSIKSLIPSKSLVAYLTDLNIDCTAAYLCLLNLGHTVSPLSSKYHLDEVKKFVSDFKCNYILIASSQKRSFDGEVVFEKGTCCIVRLSFSKVSLATDLSLVIGTSGSLGYPKLAKISLKNIKANASSIGQCLNIKDTDVTISSLPFDYAFGLSVLHSYVMAGGSLLVTNAKFIEGCFWELVHKHKVTSLSQTPIFFDFLARVDLTRKRYKYLMTFTQAGGPLSVKTQKMLAEKLAKSDKQLFVMYGQTEATARISCLPPSQAGVKLGGVGYPVPGGDIQIKNREGSYIELPNTVGDIVYSGENVFGGYAENVNDLSFLTDLELLNTGDIGYLDSDGCLFISGRKARVIKSSGINVSLDALELELKDEFGFDFACVSHGHFIIVFISELFSADKEIAIKLFVAGKVLLQSRFIKLFKLKEFPTTKNGKIKYDVLSSLLN